MITLYANWTGKALVSGETVEAARAKLTPQDCAPETPIGTKLDELTALDTGDFDVFHGQGTHKGDLLRHAREIFPLAANGKSTE